MFPVTIFGKLGSGKSTTAKLLREILIEDFGVRPNQIQKKAFADEVKKCVAIATNTTIEEQYSEFGKNRSVPVYDDLDKKILMDLDGMTEHLSKFDFLSGFKKDRLKEKIIDMTEGILETVTKIDDRYLFMTLGVLQQHLGTRLKEVFGEDLWVDKNYETWTPESKWVIEDGRFPNEQRRGKKKGGTCIRMEGDPDGVRARTTRDLNHISETAMDKFRNWDLVINNNKKETDFATLKETLRKFVMDQVSKHGDSILYN